MNHSVKIVRVVKDTRRRAISVLVLLSRVSIPTGLSLEVRRLKNFGSLKDFSLNTVGLETNLESPLFDFLTVSDHFIELTDRTNTIMGLLEQGLAHSSHSLFILADLLRDADKHA